jgi:hypothetical protein
MSWGVGAITHSHLPKIVSVLIGVHILFRTVSQAAYRQNSGGIYLRISARCMPKDFYPHTDMAGCRQQKLWGNPPTSLSPTRRGLSSGEPQKCFFCQPLPCLYKLILGIHLTGTQGLGSSCVLFRRAPV